MKESVPLEVSNLAFHQRQKNNQAEPCTSLRTLLLDIQKQTAIIGEVQTISATQIAPQPQAIISLLTATDASIAKRTLIATRHGRTVGVALIGL
ncbi:hypothetical protein F5B18DRAFT_625474 [Nemania serpens]|nr:hypothetical protein F5B18DRAFT_625474 [Nemania serpens]